MIIFQACNVVLLLIVATFLHFCQAKSLKSEKPPVNSTASQIWQPKDGTMSDWLKCHGMPKDMCQRTRAKYQLLKEMLVQKYGRDDVDSNESKTDPEESNFGRCIWLTEEQIDMLMTEAKLTEDATSAHHRDKRTLKNFKTVPLSKWPMPVHYKFDGTHNEPQKSTLRTAFQHWMDRTCIRFKELATHAEFNDSHILLTSLDSGCTSLVGKTSMIPQQINLNEDCFEAFGTPVHEIGHSLGLWHEQMRRDRDAAIRIIAKNIYSGMLSQFALADSDSFGLPYNYGSVMHYSSKGSSTNGKDTMIALEPFYQMNMGQRTGLSFHDTKIINLAYCKGSCVTPLRRPCQRGGYQNPNDCSTCICPDGFSGQYCDQVAPARHATCGGVLNVAPESYEIIKSPGYDTTGYTSQQECNWWIKVPENYVVLLTFDGEFDIYCQSASCFHWVEVKYKSDLGQEGGRFCCKNLPSETIVSESNEMMITFRSNHTIYDRLRGFQAFVEPIFAPADGNQKLPGSTMVSSTESTTTVTTTTVTPTTTTRTYTTSPVSHGDCERLDLTFLIDSSNSIGSGNWKQILAFANSIVSQIGNIGSNETRVAVTTFGSSAQNVISLTSNNDASSLHNAISTMPYKQMGGKNIAGGLQAVREQIHATKRQEVKSVCMLVIGGPSSVRASQALSEGMLMRRSGIEVTVVAVLPLICGAEASGIAGRRDSGVVYADSFSDILNSVDETVTKLCESGKAQSATVRSLFQCSFEELSFVDGFCGMTQDKTDQFHWKMFHDSTPTNGTGPDWPYDGKHYIYLDASSSTQPKDEARLLFPRLNFAGEVCVDFHYHMFGIHINTLQLVRSTDSQSNVVWMRSREFAKAWLHASVGINLSSNSQLQFIGARGYGKFGDIALDRIQVKSGPCAL